MLSEGLDGHEQGISTVIEYSGMEGSLNEELNLVTGLPKVQTASHIQNKPFCSCRSKNTWSSFQSYNTEPEGLDSIAH